MTAFCFFGAMNTMSLFNSILDLFVDIFSSYLRSETYL